MGKASRCEREEEDSNASRHPTLLEFTGSLRLKNKDQLKVLRQGEAVQA